MSLVRAGRRRGSNAIEFGLTLPVFLAIVLGVMDYGWLFANQAGIDNAASLGCRDGAQIDDTFGDPKGAAITGVTTRADPWCGSMPCDIDVEILGVPPERKLTCEVEMDFQPLIGFFPLPEKIDTRIHYRLEWQR